MTRLLLILALTTSSVLAADAPAPSLLSRFALTPPDPPNEGILFVDHSKTDRSGHLGHALVECADGELLAFFPNCSNENAGHSGAGWMEFKRSTDGGRTWGEPEPLPFSKSLFEKGEGYSAMAERAVMTDDGTIVLFLFICDISESALWRPYEVPLYLTSEDGGRTWSEPRPVCEKRGRIYDVIQAKDEILALHFANEAEKNFLGSLPEHVYELHVSSDGGATFAQRSQLPFATKGRGYGALGVLPSGELIAYVYSPKDEFSLEYMTGTDGGRSWSEVKKTRFARKIRNPQFVVFDGVCIMHGRSGQLGEGRGHFILYTSADGIRWDEGTYLRMQEAGTGAYSNNLIVGARDPATPDRLLIQASHAYKKSQTNILHWWLEPKAVQKND